LAWIRGINLILNGNGNHYISAVPFLKLIDMCSLALMTNADVIFNHEGIRSS